MVLPHRDYLCHTSQLKSNAETQESVYYAGLSENTAEARYIDLIERQFCDAMDTSQNEVGEESQMKTGIRERDLTTIVPSQSINLWGTADLKQTVESQESVYYAGMSENPAEARYLEMIKQQFCNAINDLSNGDEENDKGNTNEMQRHNPFWEGSTTEKKSSAGQEAKETQESTLEPNEVEIKERNKDTDNDCSQWIIHKQATLSTGFLSEKKSPVDEETQKNSEIGGVDEAIGSNLQMVSHQSEGRTPEQDAQKQEVQGVGQGFTSPAGVVQGSECSRDVEDEEEDSEDSLQSQPLLPEVHMTPKQLSIKQGSKVTKNCSPLPSENGSDWQDDFIQSPALLSDKASAKTKAAPTQEKEVAKHGLLSPRAALLIDDSQPKAHRVDNTAPIPAMITVRKIGSHLESTSQSDEEGNGIKTSREEQQAHLNGQAVGDPCASGSILLASQRNCKDLAFHGQQDLPKEDRALRCLTNIDFSGMTPKSNAVSSDASCGNKENCLGEDCHISSSSNYLKGKLKNSVGLASPPLESRATWNGRQEGNCPIMKIPEGQEVFEEAGANRRKRPKTGNNLNGSGWISKRKCTLKKGRRLEHGTYMDTKKDVLRDGKADMNISTAKEGPGPLDVPTEGSDINCSVEMAVKTSPQGLVSLDASPTVPKKAGDSLVIQPHLSASKQDSERRKESKGVLKVDSRARKPGYQNKSRRFRPVAKAADKRLTQKTMTEMFG